MTDLESFLSGGTAGCSGSHEMTRADLCVRKPEYPVGKNAGLVIQSLRIRIPAGAVGEFSSLESTLCADSDSVFVPSPCYFSGTYKTPVILPKVQVAGYT